MPQVVRFEQLLRTKWWNYVMFHHFNRLFFSEVKKLLSLLRCLYYQVKSLSKHLIASCPLDKEVCGSMRENITQVLVGPSLSSTSQLLSFNAVFRLVRPEPLVFLPHHGVVFNPKVEVRLQPFLHFLSS